MEHNEVNVVKVRSLIPNTTSGFSGFTYLSSDTGAPFHSTNAEGEQQKQDRKQKSRGPSSTSLTEISIDQNSPRENCNMATPVADFQQILEQDVPTTFRVPGGAAAILRKGEVVAEHAWGYANIDTRALVTSSIVFPICSISKQMVCLVLTELITERGTKFADAVLEAVRELLPTTIASNPDLTLERLVGMQSGLRDYWALSVLWGATPQDRFSIYQDAPQALKRLGRYHFAPGTQMSYCNSNFVAVGLAIERVTGKPLGDLLQDRVFGPAGMKTAALRPDTNRIPAPLVGYEGSEEVGYIPYANRIEWAADAGIQASLQDMIAYEKYVHSRAEDENSAYYKNAKEPKYVDGRAAYYGYGLVHSKTEGEQVISHSGGLAGFRLKRAFLPAHQLSVIVLLNSEADITLVLEHIVKQLITKQPGDREQSVNTKSGESKIDVTWAGNYFDEDAKLAVVVKQDKSGEVMVNYAGHDEKLQTQSESKVACKEMQVTFENTRLSIVRSFENRNFTARPLASTSAGIDATLFLGKYYSEETDSTFHVTGGAGMLYGAFDGYLGKGPMHVMRWLGENVWWLACFRSLDAPAPGNWTIVFQQGKDGGLITGVTIGCWLARGIQYKKVD